MIALLPFALGVSFTFGPWLVKNAVETGNPVYPLLYDLLGGRDWDAVLDAKWKAAHSPPHHRPLAFLTDLRGVLVGSDWQSGLLLLGVPFAFLAARRDRRLFGLFLFALYLYAAWWVLTHRIDRFWLPLLPVLSVLAAVGLTRAPIPRSLVAAAVCLNVLWNLAFVTSPLAGNNAFLADLPSVRAAILRFAPAIEAVNTLPPDAKPLLIGEAATLEADKPTVYATVFDRSPLVAAVFGTDGSTAGDGVPLPPDEIAANLADLGVTHVVVDWAEVLRYRTTYGFRPEITPSLFDDLTDSGVLSDGETTNRSYAGGLDRAKRAIVEGWYGRLRDDETFPRVVTYRVTAADD